MSEEDIEEGTCYYEINGDIIIMHYFANGEWYSMYPF